MHTLDSIPSAYHYENEPSFFESFLDPYLKYGSGYFLGDEPFASAAVRMLDRAIEHAALPPAPRVLDVGSGWGAGLRRLRETVPGVRYEHVNPSSMQRAYIEAKVGPVEATFPCTVEDAELPEGFYDAIFLSDSICHVSNRAEVARRLGRALAPGGRIVVQDTFFLGEALYQHHKKAQKTRFVQEDIFGFADIPSFEVFAREVADAGLRFSFVEDISDHYARTIGAWLERLEGLDPRVYPMRDDCIRYLKYGVVGLNYTTGQYLVVLRRLDTSRRRLRENLALLSHSSH